MKEPRHESKDFMAGNCGKEKKSESFRLCFGNTKACGRKERVRYMYREEPDNTQDSGWRFFCGEEDNAYIADPENIGIYDISTIIDLDESVCPYLELPAGTVLARGERGYFKRVDMSSQDHVVARIDFLGSNGMAGESVEYTNYEQFRKDVERETYYGAPMILVLFEDEDGDTIPRDFIAELDPPPKGVRVVKIVKEVSSC